MNPDGSPTSLLIEVDLVQAEWVVTAYLSGDTNMLDVVRTEADAHIRTGASISLLPEEIVALEDKLVGHETDPDLIAELRSSLSPLVHKLHKEGNIFLPRSMSIRQAGKKSNHALNYNMHPGRFSLQNEMDMPDAKRCWAFYRDVAYPGLKTMWRSIEDRLRHGRILITCHGDKRKFLGFWNDDLLNQAYAFIPQATVGRVTNNGLSAIYFDKTLHRYQPLGNVHDSIVGQVFPRSWLELLEISDALSRHMSTPCYYSGEQFVLRREIKIGLTWRDMVSTNPLTIEGLQLAHEAAIKASR